MMSELENNKKTNCQYFSNAQTFRGNSEFKTGDAIMSKTIKIQINQNFNAITEYGFNSQNTVTTDKN